MKNFLKNFFSDIPVKLLALMVAGGVWVYAVNAGKQINTLEASVPVQTFNLRSDMALASEIEPVQLRVRADTSLFNSLTAKDFSAFVDLTGLSEGTYTLGLKVVSDNANVQILGKTPDTVAVTLERRVTKKFDVKVETKGTLADGFGAGTPAVNPATVTMGGAQTVLAKINKVVATVAFSGEQSDVTQTVNVEAFDAAGKKVENLAVSPTTVQVTIPIERQKDTKTVSIEPKIIGSPASGFAVDTVTLDRATATLVGKSSALAAITSIQTATLNIAGINKTLTQTVELTLPEGVTVKDGNQVKITVKLVSTLKQATLDAQVLFVGIPSGLKLTSHTPNTIAVTVSGSQGVIASLSASDITVQLDLGKLGTGTSNVTVTADSIKLPAGTTLVNFTPQTVSVTLQQQ